jgi:hypothetical protein
MRYQNDVDGIKEWPSLLAVGFHGLPICIDEDSFKSDKIIGWNRDHNLILMQFTGLTDKKGVEIFEGDIIEWDAEEWGAPHRELVEWKFDILSARQNEWRQFCTVIGNIYENPELYKEASE